MKTVKNVYQFTLILKNVDDNTPNLEDSLYKAGCKDTLINFRNGTVYLDFDRAASSLQEAVLTAIKNVESASVHAIVVNVAPEDWVTEADVAKRLDVKRQAVSLWIKGGRRKAIPFPKPIMKLSDKSPLWKWREIAEWLYQNNLIQEKDMIKNAAFLENVNVALEERDIKIKQARHGLLKKLAEASH
ncbi:MAG TPA: DNA-binding protein [Gammaproteobacteria bacterium]|nr:DNA-binding protein [Gammaproteobacteria bacterium]